MQMNRTRYTRLDALVAAEVRSDIARDPHSTLTSIADRLGMRRASLSSRVNGKVPFSTAELAAVAAELGTTASAITARAEDAEERERKAAA